MKKRGSSIIGSILEDITPIEQKKTDNRMIIAAKIQDAMDEKGWRAKDLLHALGKNEKHQSIVSKWLSGTHNFTTDTLTEIGSVLDIEFFNLNKKETFISIYFHKIEIRDEKEPMGTRNRNNYALA